MACFEILPSYAPHTEEAFVGFQREKERERERKWQNRRLDVSDAVSDLLYHRKTRLSHKQLRREGICVTKSHP